MHRHCAIAQTVSSLMLVLDLVEARRLAGKIVRPCNPSAGTATSTSLEAASANAVGLFSCDCGTQPVASISKAIGLAGMRIFIIRTRVWPFFIGRNAQIPEANYKYL